MYALRIKDGPEKGRYVGRKIGHRYKIADTLDEARIFHSISGIKAFFGRRYSGEGYKEYRANTSYKTSWIEYNKGREKWRIPYTDEYELVELTLKENNNERS